MTNLYGNYFIQNLIKNSNFKQINLIYTYIQKDYVLIAKDYSGTHVLQKLLDYNNILFNNNCISNNINNIKILEKIILSSIIDKEIEMAFNTNATHVLQKIILTIPEQNRQFLNEKIYLNLIDLCLDSNGICVVKKLIGNTFLCENKEKIIKLISENCIEIAQNPYGNYGIQYILEEWGINICESIVKIIINNICSLSTQKYSSNVSEKIIGLLDEDKQNLIIQELFLSNKFIFVLRSKYGRYVIQKAITILNKKQKDDIYNYLSNLKLDPQYSKDKMKLNNILDYFEFE
jgi:hypothetical protein